MNLFKTLTVSILTSSLLIACSNDKEQILNSAPKQVTLSLNLPKMAATRGLDNKTESGQKVTLENKIMIYAKQSKNGAIVNTYTLQLSDFEGEQSSTLTKTLEVNGTAQYIEVESNIDEGSKTDDVNTRQGASQSSAVRVTGGNNIISAYSGQKTCAVEIVPEMARFEVFGEITLTTTISNLKINGFYLNNIKNTRNDSELCKINDDTELTWTTAYASSGTRSNLYDTKSDQNAIIPSGQAYGYNFFPQTYTDAKLIAKAKTKEEAAKYHPHMILKVSFMNSEGEQQENKYLNVIALKDDSGNYFESFDKGKVYQLDLSSLKEIIDVENPPVTDMPDPDAVGVEISVSVKGWEVVTVTPEV